MCIELYDGMYTVEELAEVEAQQAEEAYALCMASMDDNYMEEQ